MASRKDQKAAARQARLEVQAAAEKARRRGNRGKQLFFILGGAVVVVAILVAVSLSVRGGKADKVQASPRIQKINAVSKSQGQNGYTLGSANAPVTLTEYGDMQCPICKQASTDVIDKVIAGDVAQGKVKLVFKHWTILGDDSIVAARAAYAASNQDKYWQFIDNFYDNQGQENTGYVTDKFVDAIAKSIGLDVGKFNADRKSAQFDRTLKQTFDEAAKLKFTGTPSFVITDKGGKQQTIKSLPDYADLQAALDKAGE